MRGGESTQTGHLQHPLSTLEAEIDEKHTCKTPCDNEATEVTKEAIVPASASIPPPDTSSTTSLGDNSYPEGGLRAWLVVFGAWCGMFAAYGMMNAIGTFQAYVSDNQLASYSASEVGWVFSLNLFMSFAVGLYVGPIFDMYGPRYLLAGGSVLLVLTSFLMGICEKYWEWIIVFSLLEGTGAAAIATPVTTTVGHWFHKRRGFATGITITGGGCGGIVFPLLLQTLIPKVGFAWATRIMGFIVLFLCISANLLVRIRLPLSKISQSPHPDFTIFRQPAFALTVVGVFFMEWAAFQPFGYITSYALHEGFSTALSYQALSIFCAASVLGRAIPGLLADKIGRFNTLILGNVLSLIASLVIWLPFGNTRAGLITFALLGGFGSGGALSLVPVSISQLCEIRNYGRYFATCYFVVSFGLLVCFPLAGALIEACDGAYWGLITFTSVSLAGGIVAIVLARGYGGGWGLKVAF